jgi:hypothetical protein
MDHLAGQERQPYCREVRRRAQVTASMYQPHRRTFPGLMINHCFYNYFQGIEKKTARI